MFIFARSVSGGVWLSGCADGFFVGDRLDVVLLVDVDAGRSRLVPFFRSGNPFAMVTSRLRAAPAGNSGLVCPVDVLLVLLGELLDGYDMGAVDRELVVEEGRSGRDPSRDVLG